MFFSFQYITCPVNIKKATIETHNSVLIALSMYHVESSIWENPTTYYSLYCNCAFVILHLEFFASKEYTHVVDAKLSMDNFKHDPNMIKSFMDLSGMTFGLLSNGDVVLYGRRGRESNIVCVLRNNNIIVNSNSLTINFFDKHLQQFTYRYLPLFNHWNEDEETWQKYSEEEQETKPELDYIEEALYDGTHDKLHDGGLLNYHEAGKPMKLAIKWHIKKSEYTAYFWFEDEAIRAIFDKFYGLHPDTKTDFIFHIDPMKNKYQLALFRYGLQEPQIIPEEAYQLIVFKNKFEHFRSDNYNQPRGAWIW